MKAKIILTATLLGLMLGACKKKDAAPKQQVKLLSKITQVGGPNGDQVTVTSISYDSKNRMIKKGNLTYTYSGDDLVKISQGTLPNETVAAITYSNGIPVSVHILGGPYDHTYNYTLVDGQITKMTDNNGGQVFLLSYEHGNLTSEVIKDDAGNEHGYGLDKNPYYNATCKYILVPSWLDTDDHFSKNAIIQNYSQLAPFLGSQYNYTVGTDGYPKSVVIKTNHLNDPDSFFYDTLTFEYVMRDVAQ